MSRSRVSSALLIGVGFLCSAAADGIAAEQAQIQQAIARGATYLRGKMERLTHGHKSLCAYALVKAGYPAQSEEVTAVVKSIQEKIRDGVYTPAVHHLYEAGVDAMLLADLGGEAEEGATHPYRDQLQAIANHIVAQQLPNGGWDYPASRARDSSGDTSVMQYAVLGLWAAKRAGADVPPLVWQNAIQWHIANQNQDGGFAYCPGTNYGFGMGSSMLNMTINAVGSTYIALLHLTPGDLPELKNPRIGRVAEREPKEAPKFGVLEKVDLDQVPGEETTKPEPKAEIPAATAQMIQRAYQWILPRFVPDNTDTGFRAYYYYSLERMAALTNLQQIGEASWYDVCADHLIKTQQKDGSWSMASSHTDSNLDTAFVVLFLTRSTAKILKRPIPVDPIGGGLLSGGRGGLDGSVKEKKKMALASLDEMLAALESAGELDVQEVQEQFVEQVQIGDRDALVGKKDLLIEYVRHPNGEVRRTAVWALGRTDDLSLGRYLIDALQDPDVGVVVEARNALCWLARKPNGLGEAADPYEALPPDANDEQRRTAESAWRLDLLKRWGRWYLDNRPYADRGDEFEAELLQKLAGL